MGRLLWGVSSSGQNTEVTHKKSVARIAVVLLIHLSACPALHASVFSVLSSTACVYASGPPAFHPSFRPSIHPSTYFLSIVHMCIHHPSVHPSTCLSFFHLFIALSYLVPCGIHPSIYLVFLLGIPPPVHPSIFPSFHPSMHPPDHPSVHWSIHPFDRHRILY